MKMKNDLPIVQRKGEGSGDRSVAYASRLDSFFKLSKQSMICRFENMFMTSLEVEAQKKGLSGEE